ncbi:SPFH domain-containing protein [Aggregatilineales bacterium SYSU G02658]
MRIIDVIVHDNVMDDEFVYRLPQSGDGDFRFGSQLIVQESQVAAFVRNGQVLDTFTAGRHTLSVANLPILTNMLKLVTSGRTPFQALVYFINMRTMPQVGWGTNPPIPVALPGTAMGAALLTTFGTMSLRIADPARFLKKFGMSKPITRVDDLKTAMQTKLLGELTVLLSNAEISSVMDANKLMNDLEGAALVKLSTQFEDEFGVSIIAFDANPFNAKQVSPDEMMSYMSAETYERVIRVQALRDAARNEGAGGALAGAGVGFGVGQQLGGAFMNAEQQAAQQAAQQQQMLMNQMMMQKMMEMMSGNQQQAAPAPAPAAAAASSGALNTVQDVRNAIEALDLRLINGEVRQDVYDRLMARLEARLAELGG